MWFKRKNKQENDLLKLMQDYFNGEGPGIETLAKFQAKYSQEEHFKQRELEIEKAQKEKYEYFKYCYKHNIELTSDDQKDFNFYRWKFDKYI